MSPNECKSLGKILDTLGLSKVQVGREKSSAPPIDLVTSLVTQPPAPLMPVSDPLVSSDQFPLDFPLPFDTANFSLGNQSNEQALPLGDHSQVIATNVITDWDWSHPETSPRVNSGVDIASIRTPSHPLLSTSSEDAAVSDNDDDAGSGTTEEDLVNQLSDRLGSLHIGPNGQISYFGPTSNFSLVDHPTGAESLAVDRTVRYDGQEHLDSMGYGKPIPQDLEDHLINLYFAWQDPFCHVVDRKLYQEAKFNWLEREEDTPYYSEALRNAMFVSKYNSASHSSPKLLIFCRCSLGAAFEPRYHPTFVTFPKSLPDFFAARAKILLEIELDSPSVSTVQAMVVLSSHEIGANRDSRGWLYSGNTPMHFIAKLVPERLYG